MSVIDNLVLQHTLITEKFNGNIYLGSFIQAVEYGYHQFFKSAPICRGYKQT